MLAGQAMERSENPDGSEKETVGQTISLEEDFKVILSRIERLDNANVAKAEKESFQICYEEARLDARAIRNDDGFPAALAVICAGPNREALGPAMPLACLADDETAVTQIAEKGMMRPLLLLFDVPYILGEARVLELALRRMLRIPHAATQLVAAFSDHDVKVAFVALMVSIQLLYDQTICATMLEAGLCSALVTALAHPSEYCQSAAVVAAAIASKLPDALSALQKTSRVPELMWLAREDSSSRYPPIPAPNCFHLFDCFHPASPASKPSLVVCLPLTQLVVSSPQVALEVAAKKDSAAFLLQVIGQCPGTVAIPAQLLLSVLAEHKQESAQCAEPHALPMALLAQGFPKVISGLICPDDDELALIAIAAVIQVSVDLFPPSQIQPITAALLRYIEAGAAHMDEAVLALDHCFCSFGDDMEAFFKSATCKEPCQPVRNLVWVMVTSRFQVAVWPSSSSGAMFYGGGDKAALTFAALSGGFVPACFRPLRERRCCPTASKQPRDISVQTVQTWWSLCHALEYAPKSFIKQALRCGLLTEVEVAIEHGTWEAVLFALKVIRVLWQHMDLFPQVREAGIWPTLVVSIADSCQQPVLELISEEICHFAENSPRALAELIGEGIEERLKASCDVLAAERPVQELCESNHFLEGWLKDNQKTEYVAEALIWSRRCAYNLVIPAAQKVVETTEAATTPKEAGPGELHIGKRGNNDGRTGCNSICKPVRDASGNNIARVRQKSRSAGEAKALGEKAACKTVCGDIQSGTGRADGTKKAKSKSLAQTCVQCGKGRHCGVKLSECSGCNSVRYCRRDCQVKHWPSHRAACKKIQAKAKDTSLAAGSMDLGNNGARPECVRCL